MVLVGLFVVTLICISLKNHFIWIGKQSKYEYENDYQNDDEYEDEYGDKDDAEKDYKRYIVPNQKFNFFFTK